MNAIVTGATKGIGRALAFHLAASNYNIAFCSRDDGQIKELIGELNRDYPALRFFGMKADMGKPEDVKYFADFVIENLGFTDVLINNAGLYIPAELLKEEETCLEQQMQVNVFAPHYLSKFFASRMLTEGRGHIVNICSLASLEPVLRAGSYSISKMALLGLTKALREELRPAGIKVTAILPGSTLTDSWSGTSLPSEWFISVDDVARAVINCLELSSGANIDEIVIRPVKGNV